MRRFAIPAGLFLLAVLIASAIPADPAPPAAVKVADFTLTDVVADKPVSLDDFKAKKAVVVVFIGTECPINNAYMPRLAELDKAYADKGVQFLGINSNCNDTPPRIAGHAKKYDLPFPVLRDAANVVADQFGAERTPEAFLLDPDGRMSSTRAASTTSTASATRSKAPTRRDLAEAIDEVLAGKPVSQPVTEAGRLLHRPRRQARRPTAPITFSQGRGARAASNCQECHRPGQIGPMPLLTYEDAVGLVRHDQRSGPAEADAAVARRSAFRQVQERPQAGRRGPGDAARLDRPGLPQGRRRRPAAGEGVRRGLDHRQAGCGVHHAGRSSRSRPRPVEKG